MRISKFIAALIVMLVCAPIAVATAETKPNVIIILADDMGWKDVGYNGSEIQTPNIDMLAQTGAVLSRYYSQPSCSPARASLMTGQTPPRTGIYVPIDKNNENSLSLDLKIMPQYFKDAGYQTFLTGKWHLGHATSAMLPNARGFDHAYGNLTGGIGYWDHVHGGGYDLNRNGKTVREDGYITHLTMNEAIGLIKSRNKAQPFFLYAAFNAPHLPNEAPQDTLDKYAHIEDINRRGHAAMVDELDQAIGQIVQTLEAEGIRDNTIIMFMSDNGGLIPAAAPEPVQKAAELIDSLFDRPISFKVIEFFLANVLDGGSDNGPYRRGKGAPHEGGVLVPALINWPGQIQPKTIESRMTVQDILPTFAAGLGLLLLPDQVVDGTSQWETLMSGKADNIPDYVVTAPEAEAYYHDHWKLIAYTDEPELYNLKNDPYEQENLAADHPEIVADLLAKLDAVPHAETIRTPYIKIFFDTDVFGGEEDREPWADKVR